MFGQFSLLSADETIRTENAHGYQCTDVTVTALNEAFNSDSVNQHYQASI